MMSDDADTTEWTYTLLYHRMHRSLNHRFPNPTSLTSPPPHHRRTASPLISSSSMPRQQEPGSVESGAQDTQLMQSNPNVTSPKISQRKRPLARSSRPIMAQRCREGYRLESEEEQERPLREFVMCVRVNVCCSSRKIRDNDGVEMEFPLDTRELGSSVVRCGVKAVDDAAHPARTQPRARSCYAAC